MDILWDLYQQRQIAQLRGQAATANSKQTSVTEALAFMEDRIDRLVLINYAMWELLAERGALDPDDLLNKMSEIDLRDGVEDGKVTSTVQSCPDCGRAMSQRHLRCLYCGGESLEATPFHKA